MVVTPVSTVLISAHGVHRQNPYRKREKITSCDWGNTLLAVYIFLRVQLSETAYGRSSNRQV
jgi:hypothetical protein